jgi:hypothetical protein
MKISIYKVSIAFMMLAIALGCEERLNYDDTLSDRLNIVTSLKGNESIATIDDVRGSIKLVLPPKSDIKQVVLKIEVPNGVELSPENESIVDLSSPVSISASYKGKTRYYELSATVLPNQIAFLGEHNSYEELIENADDDVVEAAKWVKNNYSSDFLYLDVKNLKFEDLASVNVIVFVYDQVGSSELPEVFSKSTSKSAMIKFLVNGGKLLLGGMATSYASIIGRDNSNLLTIKGNGPGFVNDDTWTIDGGVNFQTTQLNHPLFTQNPGLIQYDVNGFIPVISGGFKEDHNNIWDAAPLLDPGHQKGQFKEFERLYGGKVLGVWGGVGDECCPGIIEFMPKAPYLGTVIAIGIGGIEWNMNDGRNNEFAQNVRGLYKNAIDYLSIK